MFACQGRSGTCWIGPTPPPRAGPLTAPATPPAGAVLCPGAPVRRWAARLVHRSTASRDRPQIRPPPVATARAGPPLTAYSLPYVAGEAAVDTSRWVPGEPVPRGAAEDGAQRSRPLLVTADPVLLDDLLRLCGAAGAQPQVAADAGSARRRWTGPAMVVVGADLVDGLLRLGLPRRPGVVLVATDLDDAGVWDQAAALGAEAVVH